MGVTIVALIIFILALGATRRWWRDEVVRVDGEGYWPRPPEGPRPPDGCQCGICRPAGTEDEHA